MIIPIGGHVFSHLKEIKDMNNKHGVNFYIEDNKPVQYREYINGLVAKEKYVPTDTFIMFSLHMMKDEELIWYLLNNIENYSEVFEEVLKGLYKHNKFDALNQFMSFLSDKMNEKHPEFVQTFFTSMAKHIRLQDSSPNELTQQLNAITQKVEQFNYAEAAVFNKLFYALINKLNLNEKASVPTTNYVLRKVMESDYLREKNSNEIKAIFETILTNCDNDWVDNAIMRRRPKASKVQTPMLPPGTIHYKQTLAGHHVVIMEVPKQLRNVRLGKIEVGEVGHPKLVVIFTLNKELTIIDMRVAAVPNVPVDFDTPLFKFPYNNVFRNCGVCWPDKNMTLKSLVHLPMVIDLFFNSPYSQDILGTHRVEDFLNKEFDDKQLVPNELTLKSF